MIGFFVLLGLTILPGYYLGKKIYNRDMDKEPKKLLVEIIALSVLISIPAALFECFIEDFFVMDNSYISYIIYFTVGVALVEEIAKFLPVYLLGIKSKSFDDIYDAIVYTSFSALGFATFENIFYVFGESGGVVTAIFRMIFSVPGHIGYGIIMGYFIGLAYNAKSQGKMSKFRLNMFLCILIPTLFHGMYDAVLSLGSENINLFGILIAFGLNLYITIFALKHSKQISEANEKIDNESSLKGVTKKLIIIVCIAMLVCSFVCNAEFLNWANLLEETDENVYTKSIEEHQKK